MNLADIRKRHGLDEKKTEQKNTTQTTTSHMLDEIRARHNLGKVTSTREKVEEAKAKPRLYKNEAEYYAANARPYDEVKAELDAVTARRNTYDNEKAMRDSGISGKVWQKRYGEKNTERINELAHLIEMENKRIDSLTKEAQYGRLKGYNDLANSEDFDAKSVYDKNAKATVANQLYRQVNNPDLPLTNEEYSDATREITRQMTADEVKIFNYIYNTQGDKAAQEYFDYLKTDAPDPLNSRRGKEIASNIDTDVGRAIYGGIAAVDNTTQGVKQLFTSEAVKPTVAQYASAQAAEDVETKVGKFAYDLSATVGNMAPSILASTLVGVVNPLLGKAVGSTLMGAASAGNTYTDAINSGMTPRQAMKYGAMVGASEAALGSILGGISKLGANPIGKAAGKLVSGGKFAKAIGAVDNAFIRAAAKLAGSMAGEIAEEELQLFLEPLFKMMATDEKYDAPEWGEIAYTALISAASAGLFEAPGNIAEAVQESRQKKAEKIINDAIEAVKTEQTAAAQTETAQNEFANEVLAENEAQTSNDTTSAEIPSNEAVDAYTEMVNKYADTMDANGQNVFRQVYDGKVEPDVYTREMQSAYDAGRKGKTLAAEDTTISQEQRQLAYKAGEADAYTEQHGYGLVRNESSATLTGAENDKMLRNLDRLGKDLKVKIQFVDSLRGGTARGSYRNGVISIARGADNAYMTVAKHEISHHLEKTAPKAYAAYQAYALETVAKGWGMSVDALVQETISKAAQNGDKLTAAEAKAEIAADFTEMIFANENTLRTFVEANSKTAEGRNLLQRLADAIRRFIASLKKTGVSVNTEAASKMGLGSVIDRLEQAEKLFRDALTEGGKQTTGVSGDSKTQYVVKRANGKKIAWMEKSELTSKQLKDHKAVADYIADHINDVYTIIESGQKVYIGEDLPSEYTQSKYTGYLKNRRKGDLIAKNKATNVLGDMIEIATNRRWEETEHPETKDAKYGMYRYDSSFAFPVRNEKGEIVNVKAFDVELLIRNASDKKKYLYDIVGIKENTTDALDLLQKETRKGSYKTAAHGSVTTIKISQPDTSVNSQQSTIGGSLRDLAKRYGEIAPGENPAREVHLPKKTEKNKNVSLTARTILEADTTPDIFVPTIEELVKDGTVSFETITDEYAYRVARDKVKNDHSATLEKWFKDVEAGKVSKDLTATGWALYAEAVAKPDKKGEAVDILLAMVGHQRNAAQALQATRILKKMSPEGMLVTAKRTATRLTEEANKRKEKAKDTRAIKQQAAQTDDAVRTARKDAARKTANKFTAAANSGKYEGTPFVFEYAQKVGEAVASSITREQADKEQTTMAIITSQLIRFAREKVPNAAKKSKNDILIDLVNNYDFYVKAYEFAQEEVARTHGEDERFTEFLDSPIGMDADSYAGKIIGKSIADAIIGVGETKKLIREKAALGFDEVFKAVGDYLVEKTGAKGRAENMLRSASAAYVSDIILTNPKTDAQIVDKLIREVIKDTGNKIRNTIAKGEDALNNLKSEVVNTLVNRYNLPSQYAAQAADIISTQFEQMAREEAAKELDRKFKEREIRTPKTQTEMLTELANLGAFKMDSPYNAQAVERLFRTGNVNITIDQVFAERLLAAKDEKAREDALHDIYRNIGRQMPSTFLDKWNAWRYLAMLGNPKTHIRNFSGNMFFAPAVMMKNITAAGIEKMVAGKNGRIDRTKALPSAELIKVGYNDYATLPDEIKAGEKYNDRAVANTYIQEGRQIFKNKYAEKARTFNSDLLSAEDDFFKRNHYAVALAMYCKANNIPASAFAATSGESRAIADNARRYAIKEAKKATFNDANAISNFMSRAGKSDSKAWNTFIDAVLPFRKTPANILVRGIEYSPVGLLKALSIDLVRVRRSDIPAAQMIDNIAAGMTGTGLMIAGIILSKLGVVFGGGGDKDEEEFEKLQGKQNYSLEAWGRSFTLDWLAPEALPFFVGVNLAEMTEIKDMSMKDALEAASNISAPLLEMSCLQSLNDMFESVSSAWGSGVSAIWQVPVNAATSYVTQALPTLFGQVERVFESKRETTYTDNNKWATSNMQYLAGKVFNKLPLESGQIPYIDAWGRETKEGNVVGRAAENLLSPAYVNKIYTSPMEKELQRLYEQTGEASVLPDRAGKKITVNGNEIDLTGKQYVQYATAKGQKSYEILTKMTDTAQYAKLTDADKVEVISKVYEYANALAKVETTKNLDKDKQYVPSSWVTKVQTTSEKMGIPEWKYLMIYAGTSGMRGYVDKNDDTIELSESLRKMEYIYSFIGLSDAQRQAIYSDLGIAKSVRNYTKDAVKQKLTQMRKIAK